MKNMHKTLAAHIIGASSASDCRIVLNRAGSRGRAPFALAALASLISLGACVNMPTGPSMMALPGVGKNFDEFRYDDSLCRQFAYEQVGGETPNRASIASGVGTAAIGSALGAAAGAAIGGGQGAAIGAGTGAVAGSLTGINTATASGSAVQQRYDAGYLQCMYAKGHQVPVYGTMTQGYRGSGAAPYPPQSSPYPPPPAQPRYSQPTYTQPPPPPPGNPPPPPPGSLR